jgi:hypothetical protein
MKEMAVKSNHTIVSTHAMVGSADAVSINKTSAFTQLVSLKKLCHAP